MSNRLGGKVAVVTGASKGIGAGIARGLAEAGASIVANYASDRAGADRVVAEIAQKGGKATAVQGDVSNAADLKRLFAEAVRAFGRLDVLVNWGFLEFMFAIEYDIVLALGKIRRAGFTRQPDIIESFFRRFDEYRRANHPHFLIAAFAHV